MMILQQVMDAQARFDMFATGRYQVTTAPLKEAVSSLNLDVNALYDEDMQGKIFEEYLIKIKRKPIISYLEGNGGVEDAIYTWAMEFASAGVQKGREISRDPKEFERDEKGHIKTDKNNLKIQKRRWAQVDGVSYYSGDGLNKAHIMPNEMIRKLEESKNAGK